MVETFSISEALVTPFRVIRRHPLAVFVWGGLVVALSLVSLSLVFGAMADIPLETGAEPQPELIAGLMAVQGVSLILNVVQWVMTMVIWAAAMRAALMIGRPDRFFFLRIGMDELRLAVVGVAFYAGTYVAVLVYVVLGALIAAIIWQYSQGGALLFGFLLLAVLVGGVAAALARLSLIAPATMILKRIAFVEGWKLGKGQTLRLLGLLACTWLVCLLICFIIAFVIIVGLFLAGVFDKLVVTPAAATLGDLFPSAPLMWSAALCAAVPAAFIYGAVAIIISAPFVSACRTLLDEIALKAAVGDAAPTIR